MCEVRSYVVLMYMLGVLCTPCLYVSIVGFIASNFKLQIRQARNLRKESASASALRCSALCCASIPLCCPSPPVDSTKCQNLPSQLRKFATEISFPSFNPPNPLIPANLVSFGFCHSHMTCKETEIYGVKVILILIRIEC